MKKLGASSWDDGTTGFQQELKASVKDKNENRIGEFISSNSSG